MSHHQHDPVRDATLYVSGELGPRATARFEAHLLECDACWREVRFARTGRIVAEQGRDLAPVDLRERVRGVVGVAAAERGGQGSHRRRRRVLVSALAVAVLLGATGTFALIDRGPIGQPRLLEAALLAYRADDVPRAPAQRQAPNLSSVGLTLHASGHALMDGVSLDVFAYDVGVSDRLFLYVSSRPFPEATGGRQVAHSVNAWTVRMGGAFMMAGEHPYPFLAVGTDPHMVHSAESALVRQA